jgi:hypothetical protein
VTLDLESDRLAAAEIEHARVFSGPLEDARAYGRQATKEQRRVLVAAVLRPEQREHRELEVVRFTLEQFADSLELAVREPEGAVERLFGDPRQIVENSRSGGRVSLKK